MFFSALMAFGIFLVIVLLFFGTISALIAAARNKGLTSKMLVNYYITGVVFITLFIAILSLGLVIKSISSSIFEYSFAYPVQQFTVSSPTSDNTNSRDLYMIPNPGSDFSAYKDTVGIRGQKYSAQFSDRDHDLVSGLTMFIAVAIILAIHLIAQRFTSQPLELRKGYNFMSLILYGALGIIAIPTAVYQIVNYYVFDVNHLTDYLRGLPGESLALAIVILPTWVIFLVNVLRSRTQDQK